VTACLPRILDWRRAPLLLLLLAASASAQSLLPGAAPAPRTSQPSAQVAPAPPRVAPPKPPVPPVAPVAPRKLSVGDPAPPLEGLRWLKGEPVAAWQPGTTYVVEFWAPWCPWCREVLPLYADVARNYGARNVKVVAVAVWPKKAQPAMAADFVADEAAQFPYPVADDVGDKAAKAWLDAADVLIPSAFVVDGSGRIAWHGDPRQGLDKALQRLVADTKEGEVSLESVAKLRAPYLADIAKARTARKAKDWKTLAEVSRRLYDSNPLVLPDFAVDHYISLVMLGQKQAASEWGERLLAKDFATQHNGLNSLAWYLVAPDSAIPREQQDLDLALRAARRADALTAHKNPFILDTLARVQFLRGELGEALHLQLKAVERAARFDSADAPALRKELAERLAEYTAAADAIESDKGSGSMATPSEPRSP
jgi:thiol-disulfide isomerase/thioredoxin